MGNNSEMVKNFSISREHSEVNNILKNIPNVSRYICEAIIEKYNGKSNIKDSNEQVKQEVYYNAIASKLEKLLSNQIENAVKELKLNRINVTGDILSGFVSSILSNLQKNSTVTIYLSDYIKISIECNV